MNINFLPSQYQWSIFAFVQSGQGHGVIEAVAGSGKTTTIITATQLTRTTDRIGYCAFSVHIVEALREKVPVHVAGNVVTLNSLGNSNIRNTWRNVQFDKDKLLHLLAGHQTNGYDGATMRLISLCKANLLEPTFVNLDYISDRWDIDVPEEERESIYRLTATVHRESIEQRSVIDYDDQIFFSATGAVGCKQFDVLFIDEAQDLNRAQIKMVLKSVKVSGRIIAVGDRWQSIFGFRGADTDAIPNIIEATHASTLPLSICYRCPSSHVALAQQLVPQIEAREDAPEGVIEDMDQGKFAERVKPGDLVVCRCNAPLVRPAMRLIANGIKAVILGRDIGQGLMALVRKVQKQRNTFDLLSTLMALEQYVSSESAKLYSTGKAMKAQSLQDRADTIEALAEGCQSFADLEAKIASVFSDDQQGITFSTVHRAKGTEADRVFILEPRLMPHPKASKPWEVQQERNIKYVALTRAKQELYFVN